MTATFAVAVHRPLQLGDRVEEHHARGTIIEVLSHEEYLELWRAAGFPESGIAIHPPMYFYRCERLGP